MDQRRKIFVQLLREAAGQIVQLQHSPPFLSWMRVVATRRFPEVFGGLPERVCRDLATELGRQIWNATPIPRLGFRRSVIAPGSEAPRVPGLTPELMWALVVEEVPLEQALALAEEGVIPRPYVGIVARRLIEAGRPVRAHSLLEPLSEEPLDTIEALTQAYERLELRSFIERFLEARP